MSVGHPEKSRGGPRGAPDRAGLPVILTTGGGGQLGHHLGREAAGRAIPLGRRELDLADPASIRAALDRHEPQVVINAAAYTDVDGAESDEDGARAVNTDGAGALAASCRDRGIRLVHISTDYVFPGTVPGGGDPATAPGLEPGDPTGPATAYGRTKLAGEQAVLRAHPEATVIRTAWVYTGPERADQGLAGSDFVATMARLEQERDTVSVVDDQWGSPTHAPTLAAAILDLLALESGGAGLSGEAGQPGGAGQHGGVVDTRGLVLHAAGAGRATWCEVARRTFELLGADPDRVRPCTTADFPRPAPRPAFSVLSGRSWIEAGLAPLPDWEESLRVALSSSSSIR